MRTTSLALVLAVAAGLSGPASGSCPACGSVRGSVRVDQAAIRTEGPKHERDVVVWLRPAGGGELAAANARAAMDQNGLVFVPHVLAIQRGTTVTFLNSDREQHNVYFLDDRTGETLDIGTWGPGVSVDHRFDRAGMVITLCKLHLEMSAYIVVVDGPWFTTAQLGADGSAAAFAIEGVPPGTYELVTWHKKLKQKGGTTRVEVTPGGATEVEIAITHARYARLGH